MPPRSSGSNRDDQRPKKWHALAAADVAADSEPTSPSTSQTSPAAFEPLGVEAIHAGQFLLDLYDLKPQAVRAALERRDGDLNRPRPLDQLLRALATAGVPPLRRRHPRAALALLFVMRHHPLAMTMTVGPGLAGLVGAGGSAEPASETEPRVEVALDTQPRLSSGAPQPQADHRGQ
jgi:hypothetical protein